jgi:hypothetical protein
VGLQQVCTAVGDMRVDDNVISVPSLNNSPSWPGMRSPSIVSSTMLRLYPIVKPLGRPSELQTGLRSELHAQNEGWVAERVRRNLRQGSRPRTA